MPLHQSQNTGFYPGMYNQYPDLTKRRILEGGKRTNRTIESSKYPLVSVITAVYNAVDTLENTINSVQDQSYAHVEHIIIDGASTDGTLDLLRKHNDKLEYYISEPDNGIYSAMNKGISLAKGDYICILNADDYYDKEFIKKSINIALETKADLIYSQYSLNNKVKYTQEINNAIFIHHMNINHCTFLVAKDTYQAVGPYQENYKIVSDITWIRKAYKENKKIIYLPQCMFFFSTGGKSSGNSEIAKDLIINEASDSYKEYFPFLSNDEKKMIYLSRFDMKFDELSLVLQKYNEKSLFANALFNYLGFLFIQKRQEAKDLQAIISQQRNILKEKNDRIDKRNNQIHRKDEIINQKNQAIQEILHSKKYQLYLKILTPFIWLKNFFRIFKRR